MLRRDGIVKVLDFGLAKLTERWRAGNVDPDAATKAIVQTQPGVVVGTTAYMSPEQTRALGIDARTDIWSLGVVLYELISGRTPFKGDTASDTSAAILKTDPPPLSEYSPEIPFELDRIVRKTLQKDRDERYQVVKDLELDLRSLKRDLDLGSTLERSGSSQARSHRSLEGARVTAASGALSTQASTVTQIVYKRPRWLWPLMIVLMGIVAVGAWYLWQQRRSDTLQLANLTTSELVSRKNDLGETGTNHARFSPDGKFVTYASTKDGVSSIWLKQVSGGEPFTNRSAEGTTPSPVWSPDGQQIAFLSKRKGQTGIWTMAAFGGSPTLIKTLERSSRGLIAWTKENEIYFVTEGNLFALNVGSQQISEVTKFDSSKRLDRSFSISPDTKRIAYGDTQNGQSDIWVVPKVGGEPARVTNDAPEDSQPIWTPDGKNLIYSSRRNGTKQIYLAYLDGRPPLRLTVNETSSEVLDISPDGTRILYATGREESDLWSVNLDQPKEMQLTSDATIELWPDVSPDGKTVAFQSIPAAGGATLFSSLPLAKALSGDSIPIRLAPDGFLPRWSPDGKQIAFLRRTNGQPNLWTVHAEGGDARPLTTGGIAFGGYTFLPYNRSQTRDFEWSADGSRLIYSARTSGVSNIWQIAADGSAPTQLSDNNDPSWLFFSPSLSPDGQTVAWVALTDPQQGPKKRSWSVWLARQSKNEKILQSDSVVGLVGWSPSGQELLAKSIAGLSIDPSIPADVTLSAIPTAGGKARLLTELKATYYQNIQLAPSRQQIAFVTRQDSVDSLRVIPSAGGPARAIIAGNDGRVYFSGLAWSLDGRAIYYGKQSSWTTLSMLDNFKSN